MCCAGAIYLFLFPLFSIAHCTTGDMYCTVIINIYSLIASSGFYKWYLWSPVLSVVPVIPFTFSLVDNVVKRFQFTLT